MIIKPLASREFKNEEDKTVSLTVNLTRRMIESS